MARRRAGCTLSKVSSTRYLTASRRADSCTEVCRLMDEAMDRAVEAIERLDEMRQAATPVAPVGPAPAAVRLTVDELIHRLRHKDAP